MGYMPVFPLLLGMGLPIMASMLIQALYNIVDSMYVARIDGPGLTALSLAFPVQMLLISVSTGTGVGVNAMLARKLGQKKPQEASSVAKNGLFCAFLCSIAFALFGIFGMKSYFRFFTDDAALISMGVQYTSICTIFSFGLLMTIISERIIQATGRTVYSMIAQMTGAVTNILLDPVLIFGYFGLPRRGIAGAAIATVISQMLSLAVITYFNLTKNHDVTLSFRGFRPNLTIIKEIYAIGLPSILMQSIGSIMTVGMNGILIGFAQAAVDVFGIYFKLQSFIFMPVFGLTSAMIPIVSFNYGAKSKDRIMEAIRLSTVVAVGVMTVGTLLFQLLPEFFLTALFRATPEMLAVGVPALRTISLCFIPAAVAIIFSSTFQALGHGVLSLLLAVFRQLVLILPVAYLLGRIAGLRLIWYSFPLAEGGCFLLALLFFRHIYQREIKFLA